MLTDDWIPKFADFGTSVKFDSVNNTFCGTKEYMAPEIILNMK